MKNMVWRVVRIGLRLVIIEVKLLIRIEKKSEILSAGCSRCFSFLYILLNSFVSDIED